MPCVCISPKVALVRFYNADDGVLFIVEHAAKSLARPLVVLHTHRHILGEVGHGGRHHALDDVIGQPAKQKGNAVSTADEVVLTAQ